jgi:hypothetical protein
VAAARSTLLFVLCLASATACHRYETVNDLKAVTGTRGRLTLSPEGRANNAKKLGGVAMEITGVLVEAPGDSIGIKADEVRFADLGTVPFAQGELHFATRDVSFVAREVANRKKTTIVSILAFVGVLVIAEVFTPNASVIGFGRKNSPTPR